MLQPQTEGGRVENRPPASETESSKAGANELARGLQRTRARVPYMGGGIAEWWGIVNIFAWALDTAI